MERTKEKREKKTKKGRIRSGSREKKNLIFFEGRDKNLIVFLYLRFFDFGF